MRFFVFVFFGLFPLALLVFLVRVLANRGMESLMQLALLVLLWCVGLKREEPGGL